MVWVPVVSSINTQKTPFGAGAGAVAGGIVGSVTMRVQVVTAAVVIWNTPEPPTGAGMVPQVPVTTGRTPADTGTPFVVFSAVTGLNPKYTAALRTLAKRSPSPATNAFLKMFINVYLQVIR
jgi:hypothetical protein